MRSLEKERAAYALKRIECYKEKLTRGKRERAKGDGSSGAGRYASLIQSLPAMIRTCGLGQALTYLKAQEGRARQAGRRDTLEGALYSDIAEWIVTARKIYEGDSSRLLHLLIGSYSRTQYMRAQEEALALLEWMVKFARAFIVGEEVSRSGRDRDDTAV